MHANFFDVSTTDTGSLTIDERLVVASEPESEPEEDNTIMFIIKKLDAAQNVTKAIFLFCILMILLIVVLTFSF